MKICDMTIDQLQQHVIDQIKTTLEAHGVTEVPDLSKPRDPEMGDLCFPCFPMAKVLRKAPKLIAEQIAGEIVPDEVIAGAAAVNGYVNIRLRLETLFTVALGQILRQGERYGGAQVAGDQHWMVEYSAPNTNKPLHLGHLRNNLLGAAIARILGFYGHRVTRINLINDRGVHICKSMLVYQRWGRDMDPGTAGKKGDHLVGDFYVRFDEEFTAEYAAWQQTAEAQEAYGQWLQTGAGQVAQKAAEKDPTVDLQQKFFAGHKDSYFNERSELGREVRKMLRLWEQEDEAVRADWRKLNTWVLDGHEKTYARMGVGFDHVQFESETYKQGKAMVEQGLEDGVFRKQPDGAVVCDLDKVGKQGQKVLLRSDGTSVYMTQDLGTALERFESHDVDRLVYVVGDEQRYHFEVLFGVLGLLRPGLTEACHHLAYGMIRLPEGKMKSREGTVVDADELMDEVQGLAADELRARAAEGKAHLEQMSEADLAHRAEGIGMAAIKYFLLKFTPKKSFEYDPRESIDFLGQTGPYCLYNYARTRSLLRKAGGAPGFDNQAAARLGTDQELAVLRKLMEFPVVVARAANTLDPSRIAEYLFELCKSFAFIFTDKTNHPIVTCEDQPLRQGRLMLAAAVGHTLEAGLGLLGIEVLEEM